MSKRPIVATYYFPNWHSDPRIEELHGKGWSEWRVTQYATPRFEGHQQPKVPLWGYQDESKPEVMAQKITAATEHGIDAFIFDWYCFNDGPYRQRCLDEGFLKAPNCQDIKFAMMWCNHDAIYAHPGSYWQPKQVNWNGDITPQTFKEQTELYIKKYLSQPNYLRVDGGLYFSFWRTQPLIESLGGDEAIAELFREFRNKVEKAGLGELNINAHCDIWEDSPGVLEAYNERLTKCGFNTISTYNWGGFGDAFPSLDYGTWMRGALPKQKEKCERFTLPFSPAACPGWDSSPRTVQSDMYEKKPGYPFGTVVVNNTPEYFQQALEYMKELCDNGTCKSEMIQIPCWNEWTEGAYLEPDTQYGYGFLQAVKNVFGECK